MDGDNNNVCMGNNVVKVTVVARVIGSADTESTTVDVDEEREFLRRGGIWWEIKTSSNAGVRIDGDVFGYNAG